MDATVEKDGDHDLLVRTVYSPDAGGLNISIDGERALTTVPYSSDYTSHWIRIENLNLTAGSHHVAVSNDGNGRTSMERMMVVPHDDVEEKLAQVEALLHDHRDKVVYLYSGAQASQWDDHTYLNWLGQEGWGIAGTLRFPVHELVPTNSTFIYDPNAYDSIALHVTPTGAELVPIVRGMSDGRSYRAEVSLQYIGTPVGPSVGTVAVYGVNNATGTTNIIHTGPLLKNGSPGNVYSNYSYSFAVPDGFSNISLFVSPALGVEDLFVDQLSLGNQGSSEPTLDLTVPEDGDYILKMDGVPESSPPYVTIDGIAYPLSRTGEMMEFDLPNMTAGQHVVRCGVNSVYGAALSPAGLEIQDVSTAATFERVSNTEYIIHHSGDGPSWVLVSESYNNLWKAEMDGVELEHVQVNSMVNAYYVPVGGEHDIFVKFQGQEVYGNILLYMLAATVVSMLVLAVLQYPAFHNGQAGGAPLLTNLISRWARRGGR
jgi:hypothetical protein